MPTVTLTWHTAGDDRVCPICQALEGYQWIFETGKDQFPLELIHPEFGVVWNIHEGSRAHGHQRFNCRCSISSEFDFKDLLAKVQKLRDEVKAAAEVEQT